MPATAIDATALTTADLRTLYTAVSATSRASAKGMILTNTGRGSPRGPIHHVAMPISSLVFHTAAKAKNATVHAVATMICQPTGSCPGRSAICGVDGASGPGGATGGVATVPLVASRDSSDTVSMVGAAGGTSPAATLPLR